MRGRGRIGRAARVITLAATIIGILGVATAQAAHNYSIVSGSGVSGFAAPTTTGGETTFQATSDDATIGVDAITAAMGTNDVLINPGDTGAQPGNATVSASVFSASTHRLSIVPGVGAAIRFGAQTFSMNGDLFLLGPVSLTGNVNLAAHHVDLSSAIDGAYDLAINTVLSTTFYGGVGATTPLASLAMTGGPAEVYGNISTSGMQAYEDLGLFDDVTLTAANSSTISVAGTVNGAMDLVVSTLGTLYLQGAVGADATPTSITHTDGPTSLSATVRTTDAQHFGPITLTADVTQVSVGAGAITVGTVDGAHGWTIDTAGAITAGGVGGNGPTAPTSLTTLHGGNFSATFAQTSGNQSYSGSATATGTVIFMGITSSGTLASTSGSIEVAGATTIATGNFAGAPVLSVAAASVLHGAFSALPNGPFPVTKSGAGVLRVLTASPGLGATSITGGGIQFDAPATNAAITLASSTSVSGTGAVASISGATGTISPGDGATSGVLVAAGNVSLAAGGTLAAHLDGAAASQLAVTGTVDVTGSTLAVSTAALPTADLPFTIIANDGVDAVTGTFAGLAEGATATFGGQPYRISYVGGSGNDVTVTRVRTTSTTALASSAATSTVGTPVTFTATVTGGTPTGTVEFFDGSASLGTAPISGGSASLTSSALTVGDHQITAAYSGDTLVAGSTSTAVRQHVDAVPAAPAPAAPAPATPAAPKPAPLVVSIGKVSVQLTLARALQHGIAFGVTCNQACTVRQQVLVSAKVAKQLGLLPKRSRSTKPVLVGSATVRVTHAGSSKVVVALSRAARRALAKVTSVTLTRSTTVTASGGATATSSARFVLRNRRS